MAEKPLKQMEKIVDKLYNRQDSGMEPNTFSCLFFTGRHSRIYPLAAPPPFSSLRAIVCSSLQSRAPVPSRVGWRACFCFACSSAVSRASELARARTRRLSADRQEAHGLGGREEQTHLGTVPICGRCNLSTLAYDGVCVLLEGVELLGLVF